MPRIPYEPYSTAQPDPAGERVNINPSPAAFGENVGAAIEHLGATGEQVGNELFQRALALQDLKNENDSREALINYQDQQGQRLADFRAKTGPDAAKGLSTFNSSSRSLLNDTANSLGSPRARKMFLDSATSFLGRNIILASDHAAQENKNYTIGTYKASADSLLKTIGSDPDSFEANRDKYVSAEVNATMIDKGVHDPNDPIIKDAVMNARSRARAIQLSGIGKTRPLEALKSLPSFRGELTDTDYKTLQAQLENTGTAVAASNIGDGIINKYQQPDGTFSISPQKMDQEARAEAAKVMPDSERLPDEAVRALHAKTNQIVWDSRRDFSDARTQVTNTILQHNVIDSQTLMALPGMDAAIERLPPEIKSDLQGYIDRTRDQAHVTTNKENEARLQGMSTNDVGKFLDQDLSKWQLNSDVRIKYENLQDKLAQKSQDDPRVQQAMTDLRGAFGIQLQDLKVYRRDISNPDDYDHFTGALQMALETWREDHKKPATYEDIINTIGPELINHQTTVKGFFFNGQEPAFKEWTRPTPEQIPSEAAAEITKKVIAQGGAEPTQHQIYQAYLRKMWLELYQDQGASKPTNPGSK